MMLLIKPLTTLDLDVVLVNSSVTKRKYIGSYPSCTKPETNKKIYAFISNTDDHNKVGQHWCAWVVNRDTISFFDSFGRDPWDTTLPINFQKIVEDYDHVQYTTTRIQDWSSKTCGYFCVHFIYTLCLGLDYENFLREYSKNLLYNDYIAFDFFNSLI